LYLNARSIIGKFNAFASWVMSMKPDVYGVTESWANSSILDSELSLPGYDFFAMIDRLIEWEEEFYSILEVNYMLWSSCLRLI